MSAMTLPVWPYAYGGPAGSGNLRSVPEDFIVNERLAFTPSGSGEHVFLQIEKTGENTEYVARLLARFAGVRQRDIGYAGLKDRHAVTRQWFSVWLPGQQGPDWEQWVSASCKILQVTRHDRKLKRGALAANDFQITIRDWQGDVVGTEQLLQAIKAQGIPNYFGEQRFGHAGRNMDKALALFQGAKTGREQRSLYLSAARSFLFNQLLAERVRRGNWCKPLSGDTYVFASSNACFHARQPDDEIVHRLLAGEIHPSGVLWGIGEADVSDETLLLEQAVIEQYPQLAQGLLDFKVERGRRALRVNVPDLQWAFADEKQLAMSFTLTPGSYATALLREVVNSAGLPH